MKLVKHPDVFLKDETQEIIEHNNLDNLLQGKFQILNGEKVATPFNLSLIHI